MSDVFDPYLQWLGIRDPRRPPHFYLLLGAAPFEEDLNVLFNLAERQMAHVRSFLGSPQMAAAQRLLQELTIAQQCLTNRQRKADYDARLRMELYASGGSGRSGPSHPPPIRMETHGPSPVPPAPPPISASGWSAGPEALPPPPPAPHTDQKAGESSLLSWAVTLGTFSVLVLVGLYFLRISQNRPAGSEGTRLIGSVAPVTDKPSVPTKTASPAPPPALAATVPNKTSETQPAASPVAPSKAPAEPPKPLAVAAGSASAAAGTVPTPGASNSATLVPPPTVTAASMSLAAARGAMRIRNFALAQQHLETAARAATAAEQSQVAQVRTVLGLVTDFWKQVQAAIATLTPGRLLLLPGGMATVVATQNDQLIFRQADKQSQFTLASLPLDCAVAILATGPRDTSGNELPREAAVQIVEPLGDKLRAAQLCDALSRRNMPNQELLAELQIQPTRPSGAALSASGAAASSTATVAPAVPLPPPVAAPNVAAQRKAREEIRRVFAADFSAADKPDAKRRLSETLLNQALETKDDPPTQFELLAEARDLALDAGDVPLFARAIDALADRFIVDRLNMQADCLQQAQRRVRAATVLPALAAKGLQLAQAAIQAERLREAETLLEATKDFARRGKDTPRLKEAVALGRDLEAMKQTQQLAKLAEKTLATKPDDPEANLTRGKYLCFMKGDWAAGLPRLAQGSDPAFKKLAAAEAVAPAAAPEQMALADLWWERAANVDEDLQRAVRNRAVHWYRTALPNLTGLNKVRVERRLQEAGDAPRKP